MSLRLHFRHCSSRHAAPGSLLRRLVEVASGSTTRVVKSAKEADLILASDRFSAPERAWRSGLYAGRRMGDRVRRSSTDARLAFTDDPPPAGVPAIWFTQENSRPPDGPWSGYLTFDLDPLEGRNAYFPSWWWLVDVLGSPGVDHFLGRTLTLQELRSSRDVSYGDRPGFACAFINNPTPMRLHAIRALQRVGKVDVYGRAVGRPVGCKMDIAKRYRFVMCFENDLYPGYVTEKPVEAWATGAVPLWWGLDPSGYLNPAALLNAAEVKSFSDFADLVGQTDQRESWTRIAKEPLLLRPPDLGAAVEVVAGALH